MRRLSSNESRWSAFAECFRTMLSGMVDDDARSIDRLPLLRDAERRQLLYGWNETATEFPESKCIHQLFEQQVRRTPDAAAGGLRRRLS